jgi:hypothetical protein
MLVINSNETKKLKFGVAISGVQPQDISGALRLEANGIEYGFPIKIVDDKVEVEIPALEKLVTEIDNKTKYKVKLELIANETHLVPWKDVAQIKTPIRVKVSENIEEEVKKVEKIQVGVTAVDEEVVEKTPVDSTKKPRPIKEKKKAKITKFTKFLDS